ncbi:hypothetical protein RhiirC2_807492 [Rhizophagus irregularis]|uniref:Uncharacterized protein n=1 Tax=Rhizophagus irregularis TaxID=588596 RepID=A0A2N1MX63_9GLOM|nr:hypothetical protein RhiirC2_807492 [Rhizophagus irregularis]
MDKKNRKRLFETPETCFVFVEFLYQASNQKSNCRETKGILNSETGSLAETIQEARKKKGIPSTYVKPNPHDQKQRNKKFHGQSFHRVITLETTKYNEIKCKRNKSEGSRYEVREYDDISRGKLCPNSARTGSMQAPVGKLCRIGAVGSDEGTKWTSCRFVQPCYRIRKNEIQRSLHNVSEGSTLIESQGCCNNSSMVIEIITSESNRHQLAVSVNQGPCEVSSFMNTKNLGFNYIIFVGKREFVIIFLDFYGRVFELDKMSDGPLGNYLEEVTTKPWTGEVAWDIDDDGVIFEFEYYTEAKRDFIRQDYPKIPET